MPGSWWRFCGCGWLGSRRRSRHWRMRSGVTVQGALPAVFAGGSNFLILPYVGWLGEGRPQLTPNLHEVAEVFDAPLAALADPAIYHSELWHHGGEVHTVHFFDFGAYR